MAKKKKVEKKVEEGSDEDKESEEKVDGKQSIRNIINIIKYYTGHPALHKKYIIRVIKMSNLLQNLSDCRFYLITSSDNFRGFC